MQAISNAPKEDTTSARKESKKGKLEKQRSKRDKKQGPHMCVRVLRCVMSFLRSSFFRSREEKNHHPKYAIITAT